jgi:hypothetical protein
LIRQRRRRIVWGGAVLLSLLALSEREARAAALTVRLEYAAGLGCPDAADFRAVVIARLGYDPFVESAPEQVLVRIEPRDRTMDGRIEWRDASGKWAGEQIFPSVTTDCLRLVRAMGFALAVQIQLLAKAAAPDAHVVAPAEAAPPPEAPAVTSAKPPIAAIQSPAEPALASSADVGHSSRIGPRSPVFALGAGPSVGVGLSSSPVLLARLFGVVSWQHVSVELAAIASLPTTTRRADGAGFSQQHLLGSAAVCATATRWNGCVLANAGAVRMAGDIDRPTSASMPVVEAGARAAIVQRIGRRGSLSGHADGLINLTRWMATLDQVSVWTAPRFAAALGVDASVQFP